MLQIVSLSMNRIKQNSDKGKASYTAPKSTAWLLINLCSWGTIQNLRVTSTDKCNKVKMMGTKWQFNKQIWNLLYCYLGLEYQT